MFNDIERKKKEIYDSQSFASKCLFFSILLMKTIITAITILVHMVKLTLTNLSSS